MKLSIASWYLVLVLVQAAHSLEEYFGQLWEVFPPAIWLTGLISEDRHMAFVIINIGLFVFGIFSWFFFVRKDHEFAAFLIWFWVVLELINGVIHTGWSIMQAQYTPGVITAPILFIVAFYLMRNYLNKKAITTS
ncbi:MAG: HXXEE domain-containing protein [Flavobacteriaceae bacterium]|nr:HXXEE domain-containing protein [Flavobacteriaceae bacterium]